MFGTCGDNILVRLFYRTKPQANRTEEIRKKSWKTIIKFITWIERRIMPRKWEKKWKEIIHISIDMIRHDELYVVLCSAFWRMNTCLLHLAKQRANWRDWRTQQRFWPKQFFVSFVLFSFSCSLHCNFMIEPQPSTAKWYERIQMTRFSIKINMNIKCEKLWNVKKKIKMKRITNCLRRK